jgi:CHAT domain-containing protein
MCLFSIPVFGQGEGPTQLLKEADRLAWLNNWVKAGPLYERAERLFGQANDERNALYARIGKIHATCQSQFLPDLSKRLATEMKNPIIQNDPRLKLQVLLEYVLSEPASYCIVITGRVLDIVPLAGRRKVETLVDGYLSEIRAGKPGVEKASQLYSILLRPVLKNQKESKRLTLVPDGKLHLLPFEALLDSGGQYLLRSHVVSIAPSATVYYLLNSERKTDQAQMPFLGIGGVPYGETANFLRSPASRATAQRGLSTVNLSQLTPLPGSGEEVESVAKIIGENSITLTGHDATKTALLSQDLSRFTILHFATHAVSDTTFPDRSSLVLGRDPHSDTDGLLQERDIRYLKLNADLVVLSACDTSAGRLQGQEGIVNLVRTFFYAGARTVVASLWEAGDLSTKVLMKGFYSHLMNGEGKAEALRNAKLDLLKEFGSRAVPFEWAGFIVVGEANSAVRLPVERGSQ